nr:class Ib ribonucleoside-diphosphate reductase assembly flavoprotein NrdI [Lachnospiraceae bacterium]
MRIVYASRMGHVEGIVERLGIKNALKIESGKETINEDYILFTYTDGNGEIPAIVDSFLSANAGIKAVVGSGSLERHPNTFNYAADKIAEKYNVPVFAKVDLDGTENDLKDIQKGLRDLGYDASAAAVEKTNPYAGTQTEKNLEAAFAGESQARNKYTYFASKAKKEGFEQIAALFLKTANNEKEHAKMWFKELYGIGDTASNL